MIETLARGAFRTPGGHLVTMTYREGTNDWNTLSASLNEDEYGLPSGLSGHAVDIGGYLGSVGIALAADNPGLRVTIVEPVPGNAEMIAENVAQNDLGERVTLLHTAASGDHEPVSVWYGYRGNDVAEHHRFVGNSTLAYDHGGELPHEEIVHDPVTLADLGPIDFLKIDCEGGEWSILDTPEASRIPVIVGEAHCVRGHKGRDIVALLPAHEVSLSGDPETTCGFRAVIR